MKKIFVALLALLLVAVTVVTFAACSKEEGKAGGVGSKVGGTRQAGRR